MNDQLTLKSGKVVFFYCYLSRNGINVRAEEDKLTTEEKKEFKSTLQSTRDLVSITWI